MDTQLKNSMTKHLKNLKDFGSTQTNDEVINMSNKIIDIDVNHELDVKENLVNESLENLGLECIEVLIVDNDLSVVNI